MGIYFSKSLLRKIMTVAISNIYMYVYNRNVSFVNSKYVGKQQKLNIFIKVLKPNYIHMNN